MLADEKRTTFAEIERHVGISNGQIRRWDNASPKAENLKKVADYFDVSTDYLLGRVDNPTTVASDDEYDDLVMMFRKNEMEIPEYRRDEYRQEVEKLMDFVKYTMKELDEKNKNK